jgi:hypothetical protein
VQPTGFSRGPQTVLGATSRPNGSGPQGQPTTSYLPPQSVHSVTSSIHQQAVQAACPPTAFHASTTSHSTSHKHKLPHSKTNGNDVVASDESNHPSSLGKINRVSPKAIINAQRKCAEVIKVSSKRTATQSWADVVKSKPTSDSSVGRIKRLKQQAPIISL